MLTVKCDKCSKFNTAASLSLLSYWLSNRKAVDSIPKLDITSLRSCERHYANFLTGTFCDIENKHKFRFTKAYTKKTSGRGTADVSENGPG